MNDFHNTKIAKFTKCSLWLAKFWYVSWGVIAIFGFGFSVYLFMQSYRLSKILYFFYSNVTIFISSAFYLLIIKYLNQMLFGIGVDKKKFKRMSLIFFFLFILDLIFLFSGDYENSLKTASVKAFELIPADSSFYHFYSKIYLYIPAVFEFIKPDANGSTLLILSLFFGTLAVKYRDENSGDNPV